MARIVVTRPIADAGLNLLREKGHEVVVHEDSLMNEEELKGFVVGADVLLCLLTDPINEAVMDAAGTQLKLIATYNVGYDNIDLAAAKFRNIEVTNTSGFISSTAVAEHAMMLMFAVARNVRIADMFMRGGHYHYWGPSLLTGLELRGKTLGLIGAGQIASVFATMAHAGLEMPILYSDVRNNELLDITLQAKRVSLEELLEQSDVISVHAPLLASTKGMISHDQFAKMKNTAVLINTARGPIVDEDALVVALRERRIWGAGLDVFQYEPGLAAGLAELDNVIITPHIASATERTRVEMAVCTAQNILAHLESRPLPNPVKMPEK